MAKFNSEERRAAWRSWLRQDPGLSEAAVEAGTAAALAAGDHGLGSSGAAACARLAMGLRLTPEIVAGVAREQAGVDEFIATMPSLDPVNGLTTEAIAELGRVVSERRLAYAALSRRESPPWLPAISAMTGGDAVLAGPASPAPVPPVAPIAPSPAAASPAVPPTAVGSAFSMQGFLSEHGILVLSYVGASLLIVATLLFEVYGTSGADGVTRFAAVLLLTLFFAAAGGVALNSQRLRLVGRSYVAVAALMTPLDFAAAYNFLVLGSRGVTVAMAVLLAGGTSAALYGVLAARLRSPAYAHMAMLALAVGWGAATQVLELRAGAGTAFAALGLVYVVVAEWPGPLRTTAGLWRPGTAWYLHATALVAAGLTVFAGADLHLEPAMAYLAGTLTVVGGFYLVHAQVARSASSAGLGVAAALGAWGAVLVALDVGEWAGAAFSLGVPAVVALRRARTRSRLAQTFGPWSGPTLHLSAAVGATWTAARLGVVGPHRGALFSAATLALLAAAYLVDAEGRSAPWTAGVGLGSAALAYLAMLFLPELGAWRGVAFVPAAAVLFGLEARRGARAASLRPGAGLVAHGAAMVALGLALPAATGWEMTAVLAALTSVYGVRAAPTARRARLWVPALGVSATVLQASYPLALRPAEVALALVALAWAYLFAAHLGGGREVRLGLLAGGALQALAVALLPVAPDGLFCLLLAGAGGVGIGIAVRERRPAWLAVSTPLVTLAWYHLAVALLPPPAHPVADDLVRVFAPLPVVYAGVALVLRARAGRAWMRPLALSAALVASGVVLGGLGASDYLVLGWSLLVYSLVIYVFAVVERAPLGALAAAVTLAGGVVALMHSAGASSWLYPVAMLALSACVYLLAVAWRRAGWVDPSWELAHRTAGLGGAALSVLGAFSASVEPSGSQALAGLAATLGFSALVYFDARLHGAAVLEYVAGLAATAGFYWLARLAAATNPQFYLAPIGFGVTGLGLAAAHDGRLRVDRRLVQAVTGAGLAMILGTSALQALAETVPWSYTGLLVAEAAGAVLAGVGMRNRTLVLGGSAAVALASLRALVLLQQRYPLYVVFGAVALLLLVVAGVLSIVRDSLPAARTSLTRNWHDWD
jgi:hypothetical protein